MAPDRSVRAPSFESPTPGRLRRVAVAFGLSFGTLLAQIVLFAGKPWLGGTHRSFPSAAGIVVGVAAFVLAAMAGWAYRRVLDHPDYHPDRPAAIRAFLLGSALDVLWTALFSVGHHPTVSLLTAMPLLAVAGAVVWRFKAVDWQAALLVAPRFFVADYSLFLIASVFLAHLQTAPPT